MKKFALRMGAVASLTAGATLLALPALASWQACRTDGGYHDSET